MDPSSTLVPARCGGLVAKIHAGECVLVLGPRIAVPASVSPDQVPIDAYLERRLLDDMDEAGAPLTGLRDTISRYDQRNGAVVLRGLYQQLVAGFDNATTELHRDLATLPFRLVLLATPDRMMAKAFNEVGKTGVREAYYDYSASASDEWLQLPSEQAPVVYSLFGRHDHPESMVLTDRNLLDYLVKITKEMPKLPDPVRATLRAPSTSFLFVGFGFTSWWLRLLLKVLDVTGVENRLLSLAFEDSGSFDQAAREKNKGFFESAGIYIQSGDWGALAKELVARHRATTSVEAARPKAPPPASMAGRKPLVFLSYASEDRERIIELGRDLEVRGVSVWQDVKDLRGGEGWLSQIADYIKRVDYFVFIQSSNMDARDASVDASRRGGVYNRELALALDHAMDLGERPFVFYVAFGDCPVRDKLSWLQRQRVDTPEGIEALAGSILEKFAAYAKVAPAHPVQAAS